MDRVKAAEVFIAVAERGSMVAAAEQLDMSRAMVTRYLAAMEEWAQARLLHRSTRRLSLTSAGEESLKNCRELLAISQSISKVQNNNEEPHGLLRLTCAQSLAHDLLLPAFSQYLQRYPRTKLDLQVNSQAVNLVEQRIDLAIRITNTLEPNLIARQLGSCRSVLVASPAYLQRYGQPKQLEDLTRHNCLTYTYFGKSLWQFSYKNTPASVPVEGNLTTNESTVLLISCLHHVGISFQPLYAAAPYLASGELMLVLPEYQPNPLGIYAVYRSRDHMPAVQRSLIDYLTDYFRQQKEWI
jgi:DNA-binding transcriptional LysR family regulator